MNLFFHKPLSQLTALLDWKTWILYFPVS